MSNRIVAFVLTGPKRSFDLAFEENQAHVQLNYSTIRSAIMDFEDDNDSREILKRTIEFIRTHSVGQQNSFIRKDKRTKMK